MSGHFRADELTGNEINNIVSTLGKSVDVLIKLT